MAEARFCDSLHGRLELHSTRYRGTHDDEGRAWITFDKQEIFSACSLTAWAAEYRRARELQVSAGCTDYRDPDQFPGYRAAHQDAHREAESRGQHTQYAFYAAVEEWLNLSIGDASTSSNDLIRAFAVVDRRLGKRQLARLQIGPGEHPLVRRLYELRSDVERPGTFHGPGE